MKIALVTCPFFTNGDWPPLGLACVNGALREAGHEVTCFDLSFQTRRAHSQEWFLLQSLTGLGRVRDEVVFGLRPELALYFRYKHEFPRHRWRLRATAEEMSFIAMLYLGIRAAAEEQAGMILAKKPDAVFFSTYVSNLVWSLVLADRLKSKAPSLPVVFGGPGVGLPEIQRFALSLGIVDALAVGEGERTAVAAASRLEDAINGSIPGVAVLKGEKVQHEPRRPEPLSDLPGASFTGLPLPGLSLADYATNRPYLYESPFFRGLPVYFTRGCVNRCAYCSETAYWRGFRLRPAAAVVEDVARHVNERGERQVLFGDSAVNGNPERLRELLELLITAGLGARSCAYMIASPELTPELGKMIARAGFSHVTLGIETFSGRLRRLMNKKYEGHELFESILALTRAGVHVKSNLLVGFPGETELDFEDSLKFIRTWRKMKEAERGPGTLFWDAGHPLRLEAYSDLYNRPEHYGINLRPDEPPLLPDGVSHLAAVIAPLFQRWTAPGREEVERRSRLMRELVQKG